MKKRINWWIVSAVLIIGIPVGFVLAGIINKTQAEKEPAIVSASEEPKKDTVGGPEKGIAAAEAEPVEEPAVDSVKSNPSPAPVVAAPAPAKRELTPEQIAEREEAERQRAEERRLRAEQRQEDERQGAEAARRAAEARAAEEAQKQELARIQFYAEVKNVITSGKSSSKVPEGCVIVVNNKQTTDYQNFRNGVKLGAYSGISVTKVEGNGVATRVCVNATVNTADD